MSREVPLAVTWIKAATGAPCGGSRWEASRAFRASPRTSTNHDLRRTASRDLMPQSLPRRYRRQPRLETSSTFLAAMRTSSGTLAPPNSIGQSPSGHTPGSRVQKYRYAFLGIYIKSWFGSGARADSLREGETHPTQSPVDVEDPARKKFF